MTLDQKKNPFFLGLKTKLLFFAFFYICKSGINKHTCNGIFSFIFIFVPEIHSKA